GRWRRRRRRWRRWRNGSTAGRAPGLPGAERPERHRLADSLDKPEVPALARRAGTSAFSGTPAVLMRHPGGSAAYCRKYVQLAILRVWHNYPWSTGGTPLRPP